MNRLARYFVLTVSLVAILGGLTYRVITLHMDERDFLKKQGDARTTRLVSTPPYRGMIVDRFGEPLAISTTVDSVWLNPKEFDLSHPQVVALASSLDISVSQLNEKIKRSQNREFVYLQRHITPQAAKQVKSFAIPGVHLKREYRRYYPGGEISAHVLGFTDIDGGGQEGLELGFNEWLSGKPGMKRIVRDRLGREVQILEGLKEMRSGQDLVLSLDQRLQYLAYRELKAAVSRHQATGGSVVILDVTTGEILAMVNQPSFNPNLRVKITNDGSFRNRAVTDMFEPGSTLKTFSVASALQHARVTPNTLVDTSPGWIKVGGNIVKEDHYKNFGTINVSTILQRSSNVGVSKLTFLQPAHRLYETYRALGFGVGTGSGFPGESKGVLNKPPKNGSFVLATLAFGYGMTVTPLQLAQAYAILGAGGVKYPVSFLKQEETPPGERVVDTMIARQVVDMLSRVVSEGSGVRAQVVGYHTAGKTGTTRKISPKGGYEENSHVAVFAGLAPASHPKFSIVVMIDDPQGKEYYGSQIAAPVFSKVAAGALRLYNLPPDTDIDSLRVAKINTDAVIFHE